MYSELVAWILLRKQVIFIECLLCARHYLTFFYLINSPNPCNKLTNSLHFTGENMEALKGWLSKVTQLEIELRPESKQSGSRALTLNYHWAISHAPCSTILPAKCTSLSKTGAFVCKRLSIMGNSFLMLYLKVTNQSLLWKRWS